MEWPGSSGRRSEESSSTSTRTTRRRSTRPPTPRSSRSSSSSWPGAPRLPRRRRREDPGQPNESHLKNERNEVMADTKVAETTEAQIAVHWKEEERYKPSAKFIAQANLTDPAINERFAEKNFPKCFEEYADMLTWYERWHTVLDTNDPPFWKWFVGGKINVSYNCIDRHLAKYKNKAALIAVGEPESEDPVAITYQELYVRANAS